MYFLSSFIRYLKLFRFAHVFNKTTKQHLNQHSIFLILSIYLYEAIEKEITPFCVMHFQNIWKWTDGHKMLNLDQTKGICDLCARTLILLIYSFWDYDNINIDMNAINTLTFDLQYIASPIVWKNYLTNLEGKYPDVPFFS